MNYITLTDQQLDVVSRGRDPIAVRDEQGNLRGYIAVIVTNDEIADAKRALASKTPRYSTAEVLAALRSKAAP